MARRVATRCHAMNDSCVECGGPSRVTALPIRTTQQPNLHEHSPDLRQEFRKWMFGSLESANGAGRGVGSEAQGRRQPGPAASVRFFSGCLNRLVERGGRWELAVFGQRAETRIRRVRGLSVN
jgi:hypothetical protein